MTKSQNTKNEQQKDLCITSEQLTEMMKKGVFVGVCAVFLWNALLFIIHDLTH